MNYFKVCFFVNWRWSHHTLYHAYLTLLKKPAQCIWFFVIRCTVHAYLYTKTHLKPLKKKNFLPKFYKNYMMYFGNVSQIQGVSLKNGTSCCRAVSILKCKMRHWIRWLSYRSFSPKCFELLKRIFIFKFPKTSSIIFHKLFNLPISIQRIVNVNFALSYSWNGGNFFTKPT